MSTSLLELTDGRIVLRQATLDQLDAICEAIAESLPALHRTLTWAVSDYGREHASQFLRYAVQAWQDDREFTFYIFDATGRRLLGGCGLNYVDPPFKRCNLGYWVRTSAAGNGVATAATRLLARWALEVKGFERIEIVAELSNEASRRVAQKAGAQFEGIARRRVRLHDAQLDGAVFSLVRSDLAQGGGTG